MQLYEYKSKIKNLPTSPQNYTHLDSARNLAEGSKMLFPVGT
jgi:hypothetical protein